MQREKTPEWREKQKISRGIRRGQGYRLVFQFPIRQAEKRAEAKAARKARDHALYQSAGLLIMAGLVDSQTGKPVDDPAKLLGALVSLHELSRDNPKWEEWKLKGQVLL
ncbi:conjugal transfer protein TraD, partial [Shigella dysenteriae]